MIVAATSDWRRRSSLARTCSAAGSGALKGTKVALEVGVEDRKEPSTAVGAEDFDLEQVAREHRLSGMVWVGRVLP